MKIGIPKEIKNNEYRVGLVPSGVQELVKYGHEVYVETNAGAGIGISDEMYIKAGAKILITPSDIFSQADLIIKVKEPLLSEVEMIKENQIIYTYFHLASNSILTKALMAKKCTCIAYETIELNDGSLPLLSPMSEVAGKMATKMGSFYLQKHLGGKGILMGGVTGTKRAKVIILGAGSAGQEALKIAVGLGADVTILDINIKKLKYLEDIYGSKIKTLFSNQKNIDDVIINADLIIGTVLIPGAKAPHLISKEAISILEPGTILVDVAIDQGGCFETSKPTTHETPIFKINEITHYCVTNMPGAYAKTSTFALTNVTLKYALSISNFTLKEACIKYPELLKGINIYKGDLVYDKIGKDLNIEIKKIIF